VHTYITMNMNPRAYTLPELSFYITDSCSMTCEGCITYNELALKDGVLSVAGAALERMNSWARLIDIEHIYVIGGEPLSHPELDTWLDYIQKTWPHAERYTIVTNGELLPSMTDRAMGWLEAGWDFEVSSHSPEAYTAVNSWWESVAVQLAAKPTRRVEQIDGEETQYFESSEGGPLIQIGQRWQFYPRRYTVHGDHIKWLPLTHAAQQHSQCPGRDCTHLVNGIMYRCPVQATIPRLASQYRIEGTGGLADQDLGFDPLKGGNLTAWMAGLYQPKSQCSLCDWQAKRVPLQDPYAKKIKIVRQPK
jgi:hypothetical protein